MNTQTSHTTFTAKDLCQTGIFTALIVVCSQLSIPMPAGVPMTLQTFIIPLAGIVLGAKRGTIATCIYVLLGAVGLPVFAGFAGGLGILFGMTGGFILSFPLMALFAGLGSRRDKKSMTILGLIIGYRYGIRLYRLRASLYPDDSHQDHPGGSAGTEAKKRTPSYFHFGIFSSRKIVTTCLERSRGSLSRFGIYVV